MKLTFCVNKALQVITSEIISQLHRITIAVLRQLIEDLPAT